MALAGPPELVAGFLLVFFLPGYALTKATFPEWRLRGPDAILRFLETVTLAFVLSVTLTVLAGYALLAAAPGGFQAYWTDPVLEAVLAGIAAIAFVAGGLRGAYRHEPPPARARPDAPGDSGAGEVTRELDRIGREERRLAHELRVRGSDPAEGERLRAALARLETQRTELQRQREEEYAT